MQPHFLNIYRMNTIAQQKQLHHLKTSGFYEGISYLVLLLVAMPLKYMAGISMAVSIAGSIHGLLFVWFVVSIYVCFDSSLISFKKALLAFVLSLLPFGTFFLDKLVLKK